MSENDEIKKLKYCKRCHKKKPIDVFPASAWAKDGKLKYCTGCWSKKMSEARKKRDSSNHEKKSKPKARSTRNKKDSVNILDAANHALAASRKFPDLYLVKAPGKDSVELKSESEVVKQAMRWKVDGLDVSIWRKCEFELVLKIIG